MQCRASYTAASLKATAAPLQPACGWMLLSGVASLVLSGAEISAIHQHFKMCVLHLMRLPLTTPECFSMFSAGALPATAIIHLHTFTLLGMIGRLQQHCILNKLGRQALLSGSNSSWFVMVRRFAQQYHLPDPLIVLQQPLPKFQTFPRRGRHS